MDTPPQTPPYEEPPYLDFLHIHFCDFAYEEKGPFRLPVSDIKETTAKSFAEYVLHPVSVPFFCTSSKLSGASRLTSNSSGQSPIRTHHGHLCGSRSEATTLVAAPQSPQLSHTLLPRPRMRKHPSPRRETSPLAFLLATHTSHNPKTMLRRETARKLDPDAMSELNARTLL